MMKSSLEELVSVIDRLIARLDDLESRVGALEHSASSPSPEAAPPPAILEQHPLAQISGSAGAMPVVGKALLGIAGAYLLRALAETGAIPMPAVAASGMIYAGLWLFLAARTSPNAAFARAAYATTSALILSPMLWELTLRFKVMPPSATAAVLVVFAGVAMALAWKRNLSAVVWTPAVFALLVAAALFVATRAPLPFTLALLALALITEVMAGAGRWPALRMVTAIFVDLALLALISVYAGRDISSDYTPIGSRALAAVFAAAFAIYAVSSVASSLGRGQEIGVFEAGQTVAAFLLATFGMLAVTKGAAAAGIGAFCLLASAGCYVLAFMRFESAGLPRNYYVFSTWAAGFLLAGGLLSLSAPAVAVGLGAAAMAATFAGARTARLTLAFHGLLYLSAAAIVSGLLAHSARLLIGDLPGRAAWPVWLAASFILVCYALVWSQAWPQQPNWPQQAARLIFAALATFIIVASAISAGLLLLPAITSRQLAGLRTLAICLLALALGWCGSRFRRSELIWLAYAAIAFCTLKLLFEDLLTGSAAVLAFSLFCYGMVWLLVPRLAKARQQQPQ
jgi:hypothetical protein